MLDVSVPVSPTSLDALRQRIDEIDDHLHDLLRARAGLMAEIQALKRGSQAAIIQPVREAEIIRRLAARHDGIVPFASIGRIWREILGTFAHLQRPFAVAVWQSPDRPGIWDRTRDHFGLSVPLSRHMSTVQVIREVTEGAATLGVLPAPSTDLADPWWRLLVTRGADSPRITGRLPFVPGGNAREAGDLLVIARPSTSARGDDRVFLALEFTNEVSRAKLVAGLAASGLTGQILALDQGSGGDCAALAEVAGPLADDDARLDELAAHIGRGRDSVHHLGGYAAALPEPPPRGKA